jgi:hypothetical protein
MYSKGGDYNTAYFIFTKLGMISSVVIFLAFRIAVVGIMCEKKNCTFYFDRSTTKWSPKCCLKYGIFNSITAY